MKSTKQGEKNQTFNCLSGSLESQAYALPESIPSLSWPLSFSCLLRAANYQHDTRSLTQIKKEQRIGTIKYKNKEKVFT